MARRQIKSAPKRPLFRRELEAARRGGKIEVPKGWDAEAAATPPSPVCLAPQHRYLREYLTGRNNGWDYKVQIDMRDVLLVARPIRAPAAHGGHTHDMPEGVDVQLRTQGNYMSLKADYDEFTADRRAVLDGASS